MTKNISKSIKDKLFNMADIIIEKIFNGNVFTWGTGNLSKEIENRNIYLNSLKAADNGNYSLLMLFARS